MMEYADHMQKGAYAAAGRISIKSCYTTPQRSRGFVLFLLRRESRGPSPTLGNRSCVPASTRARVRYSGLEASPMVHLGLAVFQETVTIQDMARRKEDFFSDNEQFYETELCQNMLSLMLSWDRML